VLKKLLGLGLVWVLCFGGASLNFDEATDYYAITDNADLTFNEADWSVFVIFKQDDNTGSLFQYIVSDGAFQGNGTINIYIDEEDSTVNTADAWNVQPNDDDGTGKGTVGTSTIGGDGNWYILLSERNGSAIRHFTLRLDTTGTATQEATTDTTDFAAMDGGDWNIGRRTDGNADRYFGGDAFMWAKGNALITSDHMREAAMNSQYWLGEMDICHYFIDGNSNVNDMCGGHTATVNGTPADNAFAPPTYWGGALPL